MAEARFKIGETACFTDGRCGIVERVEFNPNSGQWQYYLNELGGMYQESDLVKPPTNHYSRISELFRKLADEFDKLEK